jgi:hypothetical protein
MQKIVKLIVQRADHRMRVHHGQRAIVAAGWLLVAACIACLLPDLAQAGQDGASSTAAYLQADYTFVQGEFRDLGQSAAAIAASAGVIAGECPSALTFAPRDAAFGEVAEAIERTLLLSNVEPVRSVTLQFSRRAGGLKWADGKLTRLVDVLAARERLAATVLLPAVCSAVDAWQRSAYTALPETVGSFLSQLEAVEEATGFSELSVEARIERRLRRYEDSREKRIAGETERLEGILDRGLQTAFVAARRKLEAALGASPL